MMHLAFYHDAVYEEVLHIVVEGFRQIYGDEISDAFANRGVILLACHCVGADALESLTRSQAKVCGPIYAWSFGIAACGLWAWMVWWIHKGVYIV